MAVGKRFYRQVTDTINFMQVKCLTYRNFYRFKGKKSDFNKNKFLVQSMPL